VLGCRIKIFARFHKTYAECLYYSGDDSEFLFFIVGIKKSSIRNSLRNLDRNRHSWDCDIRNNSVQRTC